ncbi:hypothetical protein NDU88_005559 [Pleurodeles waltl]|uniref:Uncharacterized protein n=1 Tax=Pleurodeles waltl TaxID=8319 RepID=A0AAV7RKI2_PLEWA|nr:hypothetical protein NDU88_005559 [Pleurodeles waltl]
MTGGVWSPVCTWGPAMWHRPQLSKSWCRRRPLQLRGGKPCGESARRWTLWLGSSEVSASAVRALVSAAVQVAGWQEALPCVRSSRADAGCGGGHTPTSQWGVRSDGAVGKTPGGAKPRQLAVTTPPSGD